MKQVIFLSFYCKVYKKNPIARIYIGNIFIDEIIIPNYNNEYFENFLNNEIGLRRKFLTKITTTANEGQKIHFGLTNKNIILNNSIDLQSNYEKILNPSYYSFEDICNVKEKIDHPHIFVYYIKNYLLEQAKGLIRIEIKNDDSNYTNGFMSRSTIVGIHGFYIIPEIIIKYPIKLTQRFLDTYSRKSTMYDITKLKKYYCLRESWPHNLASLFYTGLDNSKMLLKMGGNIEIKINLFKKFNIWWAKKIEKIGFIKFNYFFIKYFIVNLLDKYKDENKRDTN